MAADAPIPTPANVAKTAVTHRIKAERAAQSHAKKLAKARRKAADAANRARSARKLRDWAVAAYESGELSGILDAVRYGEETGWDQPFIMLDDFGDSVSIRVIESRLLDPHLSEIEGELDDELIEAQDWGGLAAHLTAAHSRGGEDAPLDDYGQDYMSQRVREWDFTARERWFYADRISIRARVHIKAVGEALCFVISNYPPEFTADEAERLAKAYKPEAVERASSTPRERVEKVLREYGDSLYFWTDASIIDPAVDPSASCWSVRITADESEHWECISLLAEEAHVFDDEAERHIVFAPVAEEVSA
ncbi:hypothetical protein AB1K56_03240 [Microbacterium sp. BWR-S6Y]|uniref:hypothetical protein n=1 Tax=Microbacterium sp. BWR-S6Y TaxID=3232073 RepID=UPI003528047D